MKVDFIHGDIIDKKGDGLVCSGNIFLNMSGGVNGELLSRGGQNLQIQLHNYLKEKNIKFVDPGFAIEIGPGKFHFKCIVYSVAINGWYESDTELVKKTLIKSLKIMEQKKCRTVNVPALATGYGRLMKSDFGKALKLAVIYNNWNFEEIRIIERDKSGLEKIQSAFNCS